MSTHAHYAGEFGAQKMTKKLEKDPAYRAARAQHFAKEVHDAKNAHFNATNKSDAAKHALIAAHSEKMAAKHAKAAARLAPGSEHEKTGRVAHQSAKEAHEMLKQSHVVETSSKAASPELHAAIMGSNHPAPTQTSTSKSEVDAAHHASHPYQESSLAAITHGVVGLTAANHAKMNAAHKLSETAHKISALAQIHSTSKAHADAATAHDRAAKAHHEAGNPPHLATSHRQKSDLHASVAKSKQLAGK